MVSSSGSSTSLVPSEAVKLRVRMRGYDVRILEGACEQIKARRQPAVPPAGAPHAPAQCRHGRVTRAPMFGAAAQPRVGPPASASPAAHAPVAGCTPRRHARTLRPLRTLCRTSPPSPAPQQQGPCACPPRSACTASCAAPT
jgi:hypothetical protein